MVEKKPVSDEIAEFNKNLRAVNQSMRRLAEVHGLFTHLSMNYDSDARCLQVQGSGMSSIKEKSDV